MHAASPRSHSFVATPSVRHAEDSDAPRPRRSRAKRLTTVNRSTRLGKRISELTAMYTAAIGGEITAMKRERIAETAQLKALAEAERGAWMRGEARCDLDELIRVERRAEQAVRALRLADGAAKPSLARYLTSKASGNST